MGLDVYGEAIVAFEINRTDLWVYSKAEVATCPKGHVQADGPFCSQCGGKFERRTVKTPTEGFKRLVQAKYQRDVTNLTLQDWERLEQQLTLDVAQIKYPGECSTPGIGVTLASTESHRHADHRPEATQSSDLSQILLAFEEVERMRTALGAASPIKLYTAALISA